MKQDFRNDNNSLNKEFYNELLYIIGLEEIKDGGKKLIVRAKNRLQGAILDNVINVLFSQGKLALY